jgi:hypothetical protein
MQRLDMETWENIFRNLQEMNEEDYYDGVVSWVEIQWLEGTDEWCLCYGEELFEDGFATEAEAQARLDYLERTLLRDVYTERATELFDVKYEDVTPEQRTFAQHSMFFEEYGKNSGEEDQ